MCGGGIVCLPTSSRDNEWPRESERRRGEFASFATFYALEFNPTLGSRTLSKRSIGFNNRSGDGTSLLTRRPHHNIVIVLFSDTNFPHTLGFTLKRRFVCSWQTICQACCCNCWTATKRNNPFSDATPSL